MASRVDMGCNPIPPSYSGFLAPAHTECQARFRCLAPDTPRLATIEDGCILWRSDIWRLGTDAAGRYVIEIHDVTSSRWTAVACVGQDFREGDIQSFSGRRDAPCDYALNYPVDQIILINLLLECGVIVLQGAALIIDGRGVIFGGADGIGKTTLSRLCRARGAILINDDRCAAFMREGVPWVTATPWHGEESEIRVVEAPLAGLFHLAQEPVCRLTPLSDPFALARLLASGLAPFYRQDGLECAMQLMAKIVEATPSYEFGVQPDDTAFVMLREALGDNLRIAS